MRTIKLIRTKKNGKAVTGTLRFELKMRGGEMALYARPTLENADFIIPAGTYPVERTWSPKFKKLLPLIDNVPDREGIRIHMGTKPEHSKGCILLSFDGMCNLNILFNQIELNDEKACIEIVDDYAA